MRKITISIPEKRSIWSAIIVLAIAGFAYIQAIGYIIPGFEKIFTLNEENISIQDIGLIWVPIVSYIIIACFVCFAVRIFKELKTYKKKGLIWELIWGLIWGLIAGLIGGLIGGPILGLIEGLILGLIGGPILGLIEGLILGLIGEFIGELNQE